MPLACGRGMDFFLFNLISKLHIAGMHLFMIAALWNLVERQSCHLFFTHKIVENAACERVVVLDLLSFD